MKTVLIGWELGAGRGHVEQLIPVVRAYLDIGWRVITVMRDVPLAYEAFVFARMNAHFSIVQAPRFSERQPKFAHVCSLPEVFCNIGFDDPDLVGALITQWERLLLAHKPSLIISDFAPNLNMAARDRIPSIAIGTGWTIPPELNSLPAFPSFAHAADRIAPCESQIVDSVNAALDTNRRISRFCDYLRCDENFTCTLPELDPYAPHRNEALYWPLAIPSPSMMGGVVRKGGLVYLWAEHPARALIETAAPRLEIELKAYFGGQTYEGISNLTISPSPINFVEEIPRTRLMIHHGGLGTAIWCIAHQVPQLICADDLEKRLIAEAVISARCGGMFRPEIALDQFVDLAARVAKLNVPALNISPMATVCPASTKGYILSQTHT